MEEIKQQKEVLIREVGNGFIVVSPLFDNTLVAKTLDEAVQIATAVFEEEQSKTSPIEEVEA